MREIYELYKGKKIVLDWVEGIICGYSIPINKLIIGIDDETLIGWTITESHDIIYDRFLYDSFLYVDESEIKFKPFKFGR